MNELQHIGAFVIQLRAGTDFRTGRVSGRAEHSASGRCGPFESAGALLGVVATLFEQAQSLEPAPQPHWKDLHDVAS